MSDYIDRQAAIDALNDDVEFLRRVLDDMDVVGVEREKYEWGLGLIESCISDMKELPSAEVEPVKHGRWEWIGGYGYQYRCSECIMCAERRTKYCPNRGAKMDAEEGEEA